jgi:uncharacterized repeat protein (TIGR03803 family)
VSQYHQDNYSSFINFGTVFKISPAGEVTVLKSFDYGEGAYPYGSLVQGRDGDFYGMTYQGGTYGAGTVYKISPAGTFAVLHHFTYTDGGQSLGQPGGGQRRRFLRHDHAGGQQWGGYGL